MLAAASGEMAESTIDIKAVKCGYPTVALYGLSAFTPADEQELVCIEPPQEYKDIMGPEVVWQAMKVSYGSRNAARGWHEHFAGILASNDCEGEFKQSGKMPSL